MNRPAFMAEPIEPPRTKALAHCWLKQRFTNPDTANRAARRINASGSQRRAVSAYRCPTCRRWHIGGLK